MGISFAGTMTRGTIRSALRAFSPNARVRRAHALAELEQPLSREFDFGPGACGGRATAYAMDFGDVCIAWRSTGIPDITSYLRPSPEFAALANIRTDADVAALPAGPDAQQLRDFPSVLVGEVRNAAGDKLAARLVTPQIYAITAVVATDIAQRVHLGHTRSGCPDTGFTVWRGLHSGLRRLHARALQHVMKSDSRIPHTAREYAHRSADQ